MILETQPHRRRIYIAGSILAAALGAGCQAAAPTPAAGGRIEPAYDQATGRLTRLSYDSNKDGRHDTWAVMDGARLVTLEADENLDGKIDRWEYYPAGGAAGLKQPPERIERSTRFDGQISRREFFAAGDMVRVEEDTDANGQTDKWENYAAGALVTVALDTKGLGKPDRRLVYNPDGSLERIEADDTGSGRFEVLK